jgi:hypothetical protein
MHPGKAVYSPIASQVTVGNVQLDQAVNDMPSGAKITGVYDDFSAMGERQNRVV